MIFSQLHMRLKRKITRNRSRTFDLLVLVQIDALPLGQRRLVEANSTKLAKLVSQCDKHPRTGMSIRAYVQ